jgi:hypothetical protein
MPEEYQFFRLGAASEPLRWTKIGRLISIVAETMRKIFGRISLENQKCNFLTVLLSENTVTQKIFLRFFNILYDQETIEWE